MIKHTLNLKEEQGFTVAKYHTRLPIIHTQVDINFIEVVKKKQGKHQVQSLDGEDSLEKEMATRSSILAWRIPWTEEPSGIQSMASQSRTQLSD